MVVGVEETGFSTVSDDTVKIIFPIGSEKKSDSKFN